MYATGQVSISRHDAAKSESATVRELGRVEEPCPPLKSYGLRIVAVLVMVNLLGYENDIVCFDPSMGISFPSSKLNLSSTAFPTHRLLNADERIAFSTLSEKSRLMSPRGFSTCVMIWWLAESRPITTETVTSAATLAELANAG